MTKPDKSEFIRELESQHLVEENYPSHPKINFASVDVMAILAKFLQRISVHLDKWLRSTLQGLNTFMVMATLNMCAIYI